MARTEAESPAARSTRYARYLIETMTIVLVFTTCWFSRLGPTKNRDLLDFDAYHIVGQRVWLGDAAQVYQFKEFMNIQMATGGRVNFLPWTYPPQFDLLVSPLALIPIGAAYFLFMAATLIFYLLTLKAIAKSYFALILALLLPAFFINFFVGQNGFLTGGLIGLACLTIKRRQLAAGLSLGLMVVKPHLAVGLALYALLTGRWTTVITAAAVVLLSSILCTLVLGPVIWSAFLGGVQEAGAFLARGEYPMFRMISIYAVIKAAGLPATLAISCQVVVGLGAIFVVVFAIYKRMPAQWSLGIAAVASVMVSPYAYDYDLPILGVGLALLLPGLIRFATRRERIAIYGLTFICGSYVWFFVVLATIYGGDAIKDSFPAISGLSLVLLFGLVVRVLWRAAGELRFELTLAPVQIIDR